MLSLHFGRLNFLPEVKQSIEKGICPVANLSRLQKLHYMELLKIRDPVQ